MDISKLEKFAEDIFREYNAEGSRRANNIKEVERTEKSIIYEYDYTSLNGHERKLRKEFLYNENGDMVHKGPITLEE